MRTLLRRLVCWLRGHDIVAARIGRGRLRGDLSVCRRCGNGRTFSAKPLPRMDVPRSR